MRSFGAAFCALGALACACSSFDTVVTPDASEEAAPPPDVTVIPLDATIPVDAAVDADLLDGDGTCANWPDGTVCKSASDVCHTDGVCKTGVLHGPEHPRRRLQLGHHR